MEPRIKISVLLIGLGVLLAFIPYNSSETFRLKPDELLEKSLSDTIYFSADQVARFVNHEDTTVQLIDLRSKKEYLECNIPGSVNIPFEEFLNPDWQGYLNSKEIKTILYANGDQTANMAWAIAAGLGYENVYVMRGGLNDWFETVMLTRFEGDKITPHENIVFENRFKARRLFTQINSLPDSAKTQFIAAKRLKEAQLDGGCE
jgi:rhodanese-related sulfurtransferase